MAKKKKEVAALFELNEKEKLVIMKEEDIINLSDSDKLKIEFYVNVLKFQVVFVEPEVKVRKTFKMENAYKYIKKNDKDSVEEFDNLKADANAAAATYKTLNAEYKKKLEDKVEVDEKQYAADLKAAKKAMIEKQKDAFIAQKNLFKEKYGEEAYEAVKAMK